MYIVIDESGDAFYSNEIPEGSEEAIDAGIWSLIDISLRPPEELGQDGAWHELNEI